MVTIESVDAHYREILRFAAEIDRARDESNTKMLAILEGQQEGGDEDCVSEVFRFVERGER